MALFQLGLFFDIPTLVVLLILTNALRPRFAGARWLGRLPQIILFLCVAATLIVVEENINCGQFQCKTSIWPPTASFLLATTVIWGIVGFAFKIKHVVLYTACASVAGLVYEVFVGGSAAAFQQLPPHWFAAISVLTLVSYGVIYLLPLSILLEPRLKA